jgi:hypothetical protein
MYTVSNTVGLQCFDLINLLRLPTSDAKLAARAVLDSLSIAHIRTAQEASDFDEILAANWIDGPCYQAPSGQQSEKFLTFTTVDEEGNVITWQVIEL